MTKPSLGVSGSDNGLLDQQDHEGAGVDVVKQAGNEADEQSENPSSVDSSLENVFGPGATLLAKKLESNSDKNEELIRSDTEQNSDSEVEHLNASTSAKDLRKKRVRKNIKLGDLSNIEGKMDNQGASSEGEHSEEAIKEVKKPRLVESSETKEEANDIEIFEEKNSMEEDEKKMSEELSEEKMGDKDHTEGLRLILR